MIADTIRILDRGPTYRGWGKHQIPFEFMPHIPRLLDGRGNELPLGKKPVYLEFTIDDCHNPRNSAGCLFDPPITGHYFVYPDRSGMEGNGF